MKQRDVYKSSSLLVTHRLQDAFVMADHCFDPKTNHMRRVEPGGRIEVPMAFMILRDGKVIFDGALGSRGVAHGPTSIGELARTPRFQGAGSSQVSPTRVDVPVDELAAALPARS